MANDAGLFESMMGTADERAVADQQQQSNMFAPGSNHARQFGYGQMIGPLAGGLGAGVAGLFRKEGRSLQGFGNNFANAAQRIEDFRIAQANGMDVGTYRSNKAIKKEFAKQDFGDQSKIANRIKAAEWLAQKAHQENNPQALAKAMDALSKLKAEKREFDRLDAAEQRAQKQEARAEESHKLDSVHEAWLDGEDTPREITLGLESIDGEDVPVAYYTDAGKNLKKAYKFSLLDPSKGNEPIDKRFGRLTNKAEVKETRDVILNAQSYLFQMDNIVTNLFKWADEGRAGEIVSDAGKFTSYLDNVSRSVSAVSSTFIRPGRSRENDLLAKQMDAAARGKWDKSLWEFEGTAIELPEWAKANGHEAQQFRARIMELAYIAARMAEPSNRGLSDTDIKSALARIVGDSANPQAIATRMAEMAAQSAFTVKKRIALYEQILGEENIPAVRQILGGRSIDDYFNSMDKFTEKHGIIWDEEIGGARFLNPIDTDGSVPKPPSAASEGPDDIDAALDAAYEGLF